MSVKNKSLRPIVYLVQTLVFFCPSLGAVTYDGSNISGIEELIEEHANNAKWTGKMAWRNRS